MERFGDVSALDDNVESLLSHDGGDGGNLYGALKQSPTENQKESSKGNPIIILHLCRSTIYLFFNILFLQSPFSGFTFSEVGCIRTRNSKVTCCHFSSDGKLLASAGHDKKVYILLE